MKRFEFPLERVRQYRHLQMETEHARLEQLHAKMHAIDQMEAELDRQTRRAEDALRASLSPGAAVDPAQTGSMSDFRAYQQAMARMLATRRAEMTHQIAVQRQELLEARRRYEVLDRFKGKSRKEWTAAYDREQDELAGENFLARYGRG